MKNNKAIRLLAATWLIAPTILSTQSVFATEEPQVATAESSVVASEQPETSTSDTTASTDSSSQPESETPAEATYTATINPALIGKITITTMDGQPLTINGGVLTGLTEGTQLNYTITPDAGEQVASVQIDGVQTVDYTNQTFVVGAANLVINATFEVLPDSSTEESTEPSTAPSEGTDNTSDSTTENTSDSSTAPTEDSTTPDSSTTESSSTTDSSDKGNTSNSSTNKPSKPAGSTNNSQKGSSKPSTGNHSSTNNQRPSTNVTQPKTESPSASTSDFVTKTPTDAVLPANTTSVQQAIVKEAYKYLGSPYVWGAKGASTFDCSGLAYYVYMQATGHYIGGWTGEQQYAGTQIPISQAQPGDLLFWGPSSGVTHHVAIYIGNGQYIHAPQPGDHVRITSIADYTPDFAVRVNLAGLPVASGSLANSIGSSALDNLGDFSFSKNQSTDDFLKEIADFAQEIGQKEGIYASVMMAQAILESGSGNSLLSSEPNYNLFGIKGDFEGSSVSFNTLEQDEAGQSYQIKAQFRKYPSYKESLEDYADLIKNGLSGNKDFYKPIWKSEAKSYEDATKYLEGRYATDKQYSKKLNAIIKAYDLTKYDEAKEEPIKTQTKSTEQLLTVPTVWKKNHLTFSDVLDLPIIKSNINSPAFLSGLKVANVWELWYHFTVNQIPETQTLTVKSNELPMVSFLSLNKSFWLDFPLFK